PHHTGRIEFLIVRTGRSPPAAPHPVSPRRSCRRLQVTSAWRGLSPLLPGALSGALAALSERRFVASISDRRRGGRRPPPGVSTFTPSNLGLSYHYYIDRPT